MALQDTLDQLNNLDFGDIDWSRIGVWPLAGRMFVWLVSVIAILAVAYFFLIKDLYKELDSAAATESSLKQTFQQKAFQAATLEQYKELMTKMEGDFKSLVSRLPKKSRVPELLDEIDEKGRDGGLTIVSIRLKPESVGDVYVELPIEIIVKGSYHDFGTFVSSVAGMPRIVTLHDFVIAKEEESSLLVMTVDAKTYRYRSPEEGGNPQ